MIYSYFCDIILGYTLIAFGDTVEFALFANKITYLGQVLIPLCMFMLISRLCGYTYKKWVLGVLIGAAVIMFAIVNGKTHRRKDRHQRGYAREARQKAILPCGDH